MSYLALARKWRPRDFSQLVGQEHVVSALTHALDTGRVHHAFLLTGTRGIGKTTIARILAKSLNCEVNGVSSNPCGTCNSCIAVDEGRFIDLIEVDAASRTKVDDTRDLLDNVQYAPTIGQYKVYLIDEVHMLSGHSFNALLKTLEEPPEHVKFVLATTDPQKLPVTVLSRCLQFYLKALTIEQIDTQMQQILSAESIKFEAPAVKLIARSAHGSMRDGLSLLDQAIAYGSGAIEQAQVRKMLGLVDDQFIYALLNALAAQDAQALLTVTQKMSEKAVDFISALDELLGKLHRISLLQFVPDLDNESLADKDELINYPDMFNQESIQLFYQIALMGKRDIYLAPDLRSGMEMVLLRMLAFTPAGSQITTPAHQNLKPSKSVALNLRQAQSGAHQVQETTIDDAESATPLPKASTEQPSARTAVQDKDGEKISDSKPRSNLDAQATTTDQVEQTDPLNADNWLQLADSLQVSGFGREILMNAVFEQFKDGTLKLLVSNSCSYLINDKRINQIQNALSKQLGPLKLKITLGEITKRTPAQAKQERNEQAQDLAEHAILTNPNVQQIMQDLDAVVIPGSIKTH